MGKLRNPMLRKIPILILAVISFAGSSAFAQAPRKILRDSVPAIVSHLTPIGRLPSTNHLNLAIGLPLRNQAALDEFLRQLYDPGSTNYHKYLAPQEFAERFGPTEQDYQAVKNFAEVNGLTIASTSSNRVVLDVEGSVSDIERAFKITLRVYQHPAELRTFYAPDVEPSVDANLPVLSVSGLDNFALPHPKNLIPQKKTSADATPQAGSGPSGTYAGHDFRAAYLPGVTLDGSGQSVALLEFDGYYSNDIASYENTYGLPGMSLTNVAVDGGVGNPGSGNSEVALDIEMAIAMAPGLSKVIVYEAPNTSPWPDILNRMANDNSARQISCSWGDTSPGSPDPTSEQIFKQMVAQGQSFFNASGDSDAFTSGIPFPSESTNITQVGGTTLTTARPGGSWSSETVWNWGRQQGSYVGSSGGISQNYSIPIWQQGINMTANHGSTTMQNVPDVALTADNISVKYNNGQTGTFGGTSCAAPLWAAFTALVNQQAAAASQPSVGFINPAVYSIGKGVNYTADFHDITTGNNFSRNSPTNFPAVPGYDLCTGWGTPNGTNLINALTLRLYILAQPTNQTATAGSNATFSVVAGGQPPFGYRWRFNGTNLPAGGNISGVTSNVLTLVSVTTNNAGNYSVVVTNFSGAVTSGVATLTVTVISNPPPPVANFSGNPTNGAVPLTVNFTNLSSGATNYVWNFGDSHSSTNANPSNVYTNAGSYTVTLTAIGAGGANILARTNFIVVTNVPPTANFSASPTNGISPLTVSFTNLSSGATNYNWNFGDGQISASANPIHVYTNTGSFTVMLNAIGAGGTNTFSRANYIVATNSTPILSPISDKTIIELATLTFTNTATDADGDLLLFSLDSGAPTNATINSATGIFSWMPTEAQGSGTNLISVRVTDNGVPPLSAMQTFTVVVSESNLPPVLAPIAGRTIHVGTTLTITNSATDPDIPTNILTFSLTNAPASAVINSTNGIFTWTPGNVFTNTTNSVTVVVTDYNPWAINDQHLSDSKTFQIVVVPPPSFLTSQPPVTFTNGAITISWGAISGQMYRVQFTENLGATNWTDLPPDVTAISSTASKTDSTNTNSFRFYRVFPVP
ncbi:MAG TPA: protease pro-enzyme activation domain-containing protein [Methylomirabilota bacterium]|nr:protease pro-enzyme activation domain-containing protein [Methylomirabilota bacterium]